MSAESVELADSLFSDPSFEEKSLRFATDMGCQVVYITRERYLDTDEEGKYLTYSQLTRRLSRRTYHIPPASTSYTSTFPQHPFNPGTNQNVTNSRFAYTTRRSASFRSAFIVSSTVIDGG